MTQGLFRKEVLEAKRTSWLGGISLAQPIGLWVLTGVAAAVASTIVLFLALGTYTRRSHVVGQLVPDRGLSTVVAPTAGIVGRLYQEEGAQVGAGSPLARIDVPRVTASGSDALAVIREGLRTRSSSLVDLGRSQVTQIDVQMAGAVRQLTAARRELAQIENEITSRREQVRIGNETVSRYKSVAEQKYVSQVSLAQQQQSVLDLLNAQQALERQATSLRRNIAQLEQSIHELPTQRDASLAATRRDLAALDQERVQQEANGELRVDAPVGGLVASRLAEPGQAVQAGQPLMTLLPSNSKLQAQLLVPSRAIGFVEPGDKVFLRYQAYPYQKFGHYQGQVVRISRSALGSGELGALIGNADFSEPFYRITVSLAKQAVTAYGKPEPLKPGMLVDADILGEKRRLIEWVFEPLYSLKGKFANV
ncbi:HlyD family efflux transporter periplasmic adaptor subunit [Pseudoxanthomonas helianthi]|uniref:HlyD family efflux transporter periplasmic adaptor subunit n=1 Tax=Pseudoxanthomonas helianthi TaxID=1453541 RepID=A0A940WZD4_9GAMM|nr:HlyD family efflux transporter periplasmic adaptor subunit [Pseudoxanthomonas helianthi]MBP3982796.1 HlyD family efflux transporter periplasmic adaptor subunit [Pseudoxanthomonas helianthi]